MNSKMLDFVSQTRDYFHYDEVNGIVEYGYYPQKEIESSKINIDELEKIPGLGKYYKYHDSLVLSHLDHYFLVSPSS